MGSQNCNREGHHARQSQSLLCAFEDEERCEGDTHEEYEGPFETDAKGLHERLFRNASIVNRDMRLSSRLLELLGFPTEDDAGVRLGEGDGGRNDDDGGENRYDSVDPPPAGMNGQRVRDVSSNDGLARSARRGC
jgi:hypothetical protein